MNASEKFGLRLRTIRRNRELSQQALADRAERSVEAVSNLERGLNFPSFETLVALSEALGVPIRDFFEFGENESRQRTELMAGLLDMARTMDDATLAIAVEQVRVLSASKRPKAGQ